MITIATTIENYHNKIYENNNNNNYKSYNKSITTTKETKQ